ncbi:hypothetical protein SAMD00023353_0602310 [Rosellinia necatrix]|uniref:Uncharacterized protein n=1 Tax=Rosellinia necatrix TaxID=77044 RepID=A0A1S7ULQ6_ROSNE|nr:hypothetical protein SAMD00023353_0602310 [Rosellinia necatrix]
MESLRSQLAFTQGELTERDTKFRQMKAEHREATKSWLGEKSALEARIARLESEKLQGTPPRSDRVGGVVVSPSYNTRSPEISPAHKGVQNLLMIGDLQDGEEDGTVIITHSRMRQAEAQFKKMTDEVAEKTKLCEALEAKLTILSPTLTFELTDEQAVARWNQLRAQIRTLSLEYLNKTFSASVVSDKTKDEFKALSPHWKTYTSTATVTSYLFRALIWRYLLRYFVVFCRACGRDISRKVEELAADLSTKLSDGEYQDWRIRTATLIHKVYPIDKTLIDELTGKLVDAIMPLVADVNSVALKASLRDIVTATAELSGAFDRTRLVVLMHDGPGSIRTHGFPFSEKLMDLRAKLGSQDVVDLMITPILLKKDADYSVLVKAEVTC